LIMARDWSSDVCSSDLTTGFHGGKIRDRGGYEPLNAYEEAVWK
jgi:hypothetical protein